MKAFLVDTPLSPEGIFLIYPKIDCGVISVPRVCLVSPILSRQYLVVDYTLAASDVQYLSHVNSLLLLRTQTKQKG